MLDDPKVEVILTEFIEAYRSYLNEDHRGTRIRDVASFKEAEQNHGVTGAKPKTLEIDLQTYGHLLELINSLGDQNLYVAERSVKSPGQISLSTQATRCSKILIDGVSYQPYDISTKNSTVLFCPQKSSLAAACYE